MGKMWNWLFPKKSSSVDTEKNIHKLKDQLVLLEKRENLIVKKIEQEEAKAKNSLKNNNKPEAIKFLKNKKLYQDQLQNIQNQKFNIETMIIKIEDAIINADVIKSQETASNTIKTLYNNVSIESIDKKMEDIRETFEKSNEISDVISQPLQTFDESEILDELESLEENQTMDIKIPKTLPIIQKDKTEEQEIKELEANLAM